jgi:hypothetical protein
LRMCICICIYYICIFNMYVCARVYSYILYVNICDIVHLYVCIYMHIYIIRIYIYISLVDSDCKCIASKGNGAVAPCFCSFGVTSRL